MCISILKTVKCFNSNSLTDWSTQWWGKFAAQMNALDYSLSNIAKDFIITS